MATVTTNNRTRAYIEVPGDEVSYLQAYGYTFDESEVMRATDEMRSKGYDGFYPVAVTNAGSAVIVLRYFDRDGYELEGYVAGWWVN